MATRRTKRSDQPQRALSTSAAIDAMATDHMQCRDFGHAWRPYTAHWQADARAYQQQLRCGRCRTIRVRLIGQTGAQLSGHYDYADGYLTKGLGRLTGTDRDQLRLASLLKVLPEDTTEE